jgi:uncharacterized membrane protein
MTKEKSSLNMEENVASALCYVLTWLTGLIFFFIEKENKTIRFHALQSILVFIPIQILAVIFQWLGSPRITGIGWNITVTPGIAPLLWLSWILYALMLILWIILIIKAYQGEKFKLPVIGDIAEKHA